MTSDNIEGTTDGVDYNRPLFVIQELETEGTVLDGFVCLPMIFSSASMSTVFPAGLGGWLGQPRHVCMSAM